MRMTLGPNQYTYFAAQLSISTCHYCMACAYGNFTKVSLRSDVVMLPKSDQNIGKRHLHNLSSRPASMPRSFRLSKTQSS